MEGGNLLRHILCIFWKFGYFSMGRAERGQSMGWPANGFIVPRSGPQPASKLNIQTLILIIIVAKRKIVGTG